MGDRSRHVISPRLLQGATSFDQAFGQQHENDGWYMGDNPERWRHCCWN